MRRGWRREPSGNSSGRSSTTTPRPSSIRCSCGSSRKSRFRTSACGYYPPLPVRSPSPHSSSCCRARVSPGGPRCSPDCCRLSRWPRSSKATASWRIPWTRWSPRSSSLVCCGGFGTVAGAVCSPPVSFSVRCSCTDWFSSELRCWRPVSSCPACVAGRHGRRPMDSASGSRSHGLRLAREAQPGYSCRPRSSLPRAGSVSLPPGATRWPAADSTCLRAAPSSVTCATRTTAAT